MDAKYSDDHLGYFTARIPVMEKTGRSEVFSLYAFDTETFKCAEMTGLPGTNCIASDAVSWFMENQINNSHQYEWRDFIFMHQPL